MLQANANCEPHLITRSARTQLHRYPWGSKPSLRTEKKMVRKQFRQKCRQAIHQIKHLICGCANCEEMEEAGIGQIENIIPKNTIGWSDLD